LTPQGFIRTTGGGVIACVQTAPPPGSERALPQPRAAGGWRGAPLPRMESPARRDARLSLLLRELCPLQRPPRSQPEPHALVAALFCLPPAARYLHLQSGSPSSAAPLLGPGKRPCEGLGLKCKAVERKLEARGTCAQLFFFKSPLVSSFGLPPFLSCLV
jgi:hypothetical protein